MEWAVWERWEANLVLSLCPVLELLDQQVELELKVLRPQVRVQMVLRLNSNNNNNNPILSLPWEAWAEWEVWEELTLP